MRLLEPDALVSAAAVPPNLLHKTNCGVSTNKEEWSGDTRNPRPFYLARGTCLRGSGVQTTEGGSGKKKQYSSFVASRFPWSLPRSFPLSELAGGLPLMWSIIINRVLLVSFATLLHRIFLLAAA